MPMDFVLQYNSIMQYQLPKLPFSQEALEPYMDSKTIQIHYGGHHKTYVDKLNEILRNHPSNQLKVEDLLMKIETLPSQIRTGVKNNAGGHANHTLFWSILLPTREKKPTGDVAKAIESTFSTFENFKEKFTTLSLNHFSNGWAWLCVNKSGELTLLSTKDHESPISEKLIPLLVLDLWEHAYYLK